MQFQELKAKQVWLVDDPRRICRVKEKTRIVVAVRDETGMTRMEERDAWIVDSTIPTRAIQGLISDKAAQEGNVIANAMPLREEDGTSTRLWNETWSECIVPALKTPEGKPAYRDKTQYVRQLYVAGESGRMSIQQRSCPLVCKPVEGKRVPDEDAPLDIFLDPKQGGQSSPSADLAAEPKRKQTPRRNISASAVTGG